MAVAPSCYVGAFFSAGTGKLVRVDGDMDGTKLEERVLRAAKDLRLWQRLNIQEDIRSDLQQCVLTQLNNTIELQATLFFQSSSLLQLKKKSKPYIL